MIKKFIANIVINIHRKTPVFRGKQYLVRLLERVIGAINLKTKDGIFLKTQITSSMDLSYLQEGGHDLIRNQINSLEDGDFFIDIGANSGYFSILASKKVKEKGIVLSFEPSQREYAKLLANISNNNCTNVTPINIALGEISNLNSINIAKEHTGLNQIIINI